jgi:hypothetical protein
MIYPAFFDLYSDDVVMKHPAALRVYAWLLRDPTTFIRPKRVTNFALATGIHVRKSATASSGLSLLIARGYVKLCHRDETKARHVMLNVEREDRSPGRHDAKSA